jgi:hypothetical protein
MIASGTLLNGRYLLEAELRRGRVGIVYRAQDTLLQRDVLYWKNSGGIR